jgi:hypothetical protein
MSTIPPGVGAGTIIGAQERAKSVSDTILKIPIFFIFYSLDFEK